MDGKSLEADIENAEAEKYWRPMNELVAVGKQFL